MIKVTGLWEKERQGGGIYYSARLGSIKVLLFPVDRKGENSPAFDMYISQLESRND